MANKTIAILFGLLALSSTAWATYTIGTTAYTSSATSGAFTAKPQQVFIYSNTTDATNWAGTVGTNAVAFGQGPNSSFVNVWGVQYDGTTAFALTKAVKRIINATAASDGTDTEATTVVSSETTVSLSTNCKSSSGPTQFGTAADFLFIACVGQDSASNDVVYVTVINGTSAASPVSLASTTVATGNAIYTQYKFNIIGSYVADSVFYVMYAAQSKCVAVGTGTCTASTTYAYTDIFVQGVFGNASKVWTTAANPITGQTGTSGYSGYLSADLQTSATKLYAVFKDATSTNLLTKMSTITISSGSAGGASTLATDTAPATSTVTSAVLYTPIGGFASMVTSGLGLGVDYQTYVSSTSTTHVYGIAIAYNASTTITSVANFTSANAAGSMLRGTAFGNSTINGYALAMGYPTSTTATPTSLVWQEFYPNGTSVASSTSFGSFTSSATGGFLDQSYNWWVGYTDLDSTNSVVTAGYLGKLIGSVYSYGNFLTSTVAFLLFVVATLFTF